MRIAIGSFIAFILSEGAVQAFAPFRPAAAIRLCSSPDTFYSEIRASASGDGNEKPEVKPDILEPFPPAADPMYSVRGPVGEGDFVLTRSGGPVAEELTNENLLRILKIECSDLEVSMNAFWTEMFVFQSCRSRIMFRTNSL